MTQLVSNSSETIHERIGRWQLADGFPIAINIKKSDGIWIYDDMTDKRYLDAFTCFASWPLGYNHEGFNDPIFEEELLRAAKTNVSNSDVYSEEMAKFVECFGSRVSPENYKHHFWIAGGCLAVENAMKTAFDWKARKLGRTDFDTCCDDLQILHFDHAFHGRSGYTMSVTHTLPDKVGLFPKYRWPQVHSPAIEYGSEGNIINDIQAEEDLSCAQIEKIMSSNKIAGILIEPMQGEGGDRHFRPEFLKKLRAFADKYECLLIFDEVQTGFYGSGERWLWEKLGVAPDVVSFGKKAQVCGIYASDRVEEVEDNVFHKSSRINSTWGSNLVDMVRSRRFVEIIEQQNIQDQVRKTGDYVLKELRNISKSNQSLLNIRGHGSLIAFTLPNASLRDKLVGAFMDNEMIALGCGPKSIRFRLPLIMNLNEAGMLLDRLNDSLKAL